MYIFKSYTVCSDMYRLSYVLSVLRCPAVLVLCMSVCRLLRNSIHVSVSAPLSQRQIPVYLLYLANQVSPTQTLISLHCSLSTSQLCGLPRRDTQAQSTLMCLKMTSGPPTSSTSDGPHSPTQKASLPATTSRTVRSKTSPTESS